MKVTTVYTCTQCAHNSPKWLGKCPQCDAWNSFSEEQVIKKTAAQKKIQSHARTSRNFSEVIANLSSDSRVPIGMSEIDRVLGGGIMPGSLILLTGEPGIGKSTLTLQIAEHISKQKKSVLYISGEESESQVSTRGQRLGLKLDNLNLLSETNLETVLATAEKESCDFLIIDSIQVMASNAIPGNAGSVSQVRLCTEAIMEFAKPKGLPVLIIGHVTKDGTLAGPRVLEHLVDCVLYLEGDRMHDVRLLRSVKNRFGSIHEVGIFSMGESGLNEVNNPASLFIEKHGESPMGTALTMTLEGSRPILVEVQALTSPTVFGYPRRTTTGFDINKMHMLIAVIGKYLDVNLTNQDVYVNVLGGYKLTDPQGDLGVCLAILASFLNVRLPTTTVVFGEVSLSGEIRQSSHTQRLLGEAKRLGFTPKEGKLLRDFLVLFRKG